MRSFLKGDLVDLACGNNALVRSYGRGEGVDVQDFGADRVVDDLAVLPYEDQSVDTVTIMAALNYFPEPEKVLAEVKRILKPDGHLIVTMANPTVMRFWHQFREKEAYRPAVPDQEIQNLCERQGLVGLHRAAFMAGLNHVYIFSPRRES